MFLVPFITSRITTLWGAVLSAFITISTMAPFLYGILRLRPEAISFYQRFLKKLPRLVALLLILLPKIVCVALILSVLMPLFPAARFILIIVSMLVCAFIAFNPKYEFRSKKMENTFLENLKDNS
jgi:hypothetical protein